MMKINLLRVLQTCLFMNLSRVIYISAVDQGGSVKCSFDSPHKFGGPHHLDIKGNCFGSDSYFYSASDPPGSHRHVEIIRKAGEFGELDHTQQPPVRTRQHAD